MARSTRSRWAYVWVGGRHGAPGSRLISLRPLDTKESEVSFLNHYEVRVAVPGEAAIGTVEREWSTPRIWTAVLDADSSVMESTLEVRRDFRTRREAVEFLVRESNR